MNEKYMGLGPSMMRKVLFAISLVACFLFELNGTYAYEVVDPFAANGTLIQMPIFEPVFLDQLYSSGVVPVIHNSSVEFYLAGNENCFLAEGDMCTAIFCGNAICGSTMLDVELPGKKIIKEGLIFGNKETHDTIMLENAMRYSALSSEKHLSIVERSIAESQGSPLDARYIDERYHSSIDELINREILSDGALSNLGSTIKNGNTDAAIRALDSYFEKNYEISSAYDAQDIFNAVNDRKIGPVQYSEILSRILSQNGIDDDIGSLMNKSEILGDALNQEMINQALNTLGEHPELMGELKKSMDMIDDELFSKVVSKALEDSMKNKELMKKLLEILPDIMKDEKMRDVFLKSAADAMRQMQATGVLNKLLDNIDDAKIREQVLDYAKDSTPSFLKGARDKARGLLQWDYVLPVMAFVMMIIVLMKVRL